MQNIRNIDNILLLNKQRKQAYFREYDPVLGDELGETCPRISLQLDGITYFIPDNMLESNFIYNLKEYENDPEVLLQELPERVKEINFKSIVERFLQERWKYDFEFWAYTCVKIQDKKSKKMIPLKLNRGQRKLIGIFEKQRLSGVPIRVILVKARQWGGSTAIEAYMLWLQLFHFENWHSFIISQLQSQATNIRNMIGKIIKNLPMVHPDISLSTFEGRQTMKYIPQRGCMICINSAEQPDAARSFDFSMVHMSEVALWPDTPSKSGDDIAQAIYSTVPDEPGTLIVMESTAKGIGTYFHREYLNAVENRNNQVQGLYSVFVSWFEIEMYTKSISDYKKFISTLTEYEWWQWEQGATLEGIFWYRSYKKAKKFSDFQMKSEYPTTAEEAFQTKSGKYFPDEYISKLRASCCEPKFIGEIKGLGLKGEKALQDINLIPNTGLTDALKIWIEPYYGVNKAIEAVINRFVVIVDIGGTHYKSDYSVISVFDRLSLMEPHGALERAALWRGHIDHDLLAWKAVQIAKFYENALLVIESNTIDSRDKKEKGESVYTGDHFYTVLNEIGEVYNNLYQREAPPDALTGKPLMKIGWHMNSKTKYLAYDCYTEKVRDGYYIEYSHEAVNEAQWLNVNSKGQIEAMIGQKDDIQDTTAVGNYIAYKQMPLPTIISFKQKRKTFSNKKGGTATF